MTIHVKPGIEIEPCITVRDENGDFVDRPADDQTPEFWGVYRRNGDELAVHQNDFPTLFAAKQYAETLTPVYQNGDAPDLDDDGSDENGEYEFINHYQCTHCGNTWSDHWSAQSDDDCSNCGANMQPYHSDENPDYKRLKQ